MSQMLGLNPEYRWSRPGRFGRPFYSELHTTPRYPDGQIVWQGTEIAWLGTRGSDPIRDYVRVELRKRQPAALRTYPTGSAEILQSLRDGSNVHFEDALKRARAWSPLD